MDHRALFKLYDKVNSTLGFANVDCMGQHCDFCERKIGHAFLFPLEDEYLKKRLGMTLPSEDVTVNGTLIKKLGTKKSGLCKFFKNDKCVIQGLKPLECKLYPLIVCEDKNSVKLELDMRCPEAMKIKKNKKYLKSVLPSLKDLISRLPKGYFVARRILPDEMGSGLKTARIATLREI